MTGWPRPRDPAEAGDIDHDTTIEEAVWPDAPADLHETWTCTDLSSAEWAGRVVARHRRRLTAAEAEYARVLGEMNLWITRERGIYDAKTNYLTAQLMRWHSAIHAERLADGVEDKKLPDKTITLSSGVVLRSRASKGGLVVDDEQALITWATDIVVDPDTGEVLGQRAPKAVRSIEKIDRAGLAEALDGIEKLPAGVRFEPHRRTYAVVPPSAGADQGEADE